MLDFSLTLRIDNVYSLHAMLGTGVKTCDEDDDNDDVDDDDDSSKIKYFQWWASLWLMIDMSDSTNEWNEK